MSQGKMFIELEGIVKLFPGVRALDGVSFDIREGECHALCGENGAGKSTLIKVMTGAHERTEGHYRIDGQEVAFKSTQEAINMGVSCVYQELSIVPEQSVAKNLFIGNLPKKSGLIDYKKLYDDTKKVLEQLGMDVDPKDLAGGLSIGQQQMIEIGRALTRNARLIIMDEPTSSLSEAETDTLFKIVEKLTKQNIAIVYISHKLDEVMHLSDRITVIRDGKNIVTLDTKDTTQEQLIANMIGRSLDNMYCKTPATIGESVLEVVKISSRNVFHDIEFTVHKGEVVGFFGLVGAGRSEIMRAIFGVDRYDSGMVRMTGQDLKPHDPAASILNGIAFATEDRKKEGLMLKLSILMNMTIVNLGRLSHHGIMDKKKQFDAAEEFVGELSVKTPSVTQLVGNLSGGNQQKVVLAKWLMVSPQLLIIDEPTRGIDVGSKAEIYSIINDLAQSGVAIIVVSSEIEEVMGVSDRVITIFDGKQTADLQVTPELTREEVLTCALGGAPKHE